MSYDPTPTGHTTSDASGRPESLHVHVTGRNDADVLYIVSKPRNGVVEVREIVGGCAPNEYAMDAQELLERFERAGRERRRMTVEMHAIRRWLEA